jgi:hypothetical protein
MLDEMWKVVVTPAEPAPACCKPGAGVQDIRMNEISNTLDSGLRRNDRFGFFSDFFSILLTSHYPFFAINDAHRRHQ